MSPAIAEQELDVSEIVRLVGAYRSARVLTSAVYLGVFDALVDGPCEASTLARTLGADARALEVLLDALVSLRFARKDELGRYANTPVSSSYLTRGTPGSLAANLRYQELLAPAWAELPAVVRNGAPRRNLSNLLVNDPEFTREYIRGMSEIAGPPARELATKLDLSSSLKALDVGGGPGTYSLALLEARPELEATILDLPSTLKIAAELLQSHPLRGRIRLQAGDYHRSDWGRDAYDLVLMSHITHDEGEQENRALIAKALRALRPGGMLVIHDFMLQPDKTAPVFAALFAVHMLVYTRSGRVYSADEYEGWLADAGFSDPRRLTVCLQAATSSRAVIGFKP